MVLKKNSFTFVASGCPVVQEIFGKTLTFIPAIQTNHHIDVADYQQSKKQAYILMRVGGVDRSYLEKVDAGTILYAKGFSEEVPKGYVENISTKLFVSEEIGVVEPVKPQVSLYTEVDEIEDVTEEESIEEIMEA